MFLKKIAFIGLITIMFANLFAQEKEAKVTFKLNFDKQNKAIKALGNPNGKFLGKNEELKLIKGIKGKGMLTGKSGQALQFKAKNNISQIQGTVTFWLKLNEGYRWYKEKNKYCIYFEWSGAGMVMRFYKYNKYERPFLHYTNKATKEVKTVFSPNKKTLDENKWHFYSFTWKERTLNLYIDGEFIGNMILKEPVPSKKQGGVFSVGQNWGAGDESAVIDEFTVYDKALPQAEIFKLFAKESNLFTPQKVLISSTDKQIKVDGKLSLEEWRDAAVIPLMIDKKRRTVVSAPAYLYLTYDAENLYFFLKSPLGKQFFNNAHSKLLHGFFLRERTTRDLDIDNDDSFELTFRRDNSLDVYHMSLNTLDVRYDYILTKGGIPAILGWNPDWKVKSTIQEGGWFAEGAIPWSALKGMPAKNVSWEMNFNRIWKLLKQEQDMWAVGSLPVTPQKKAFSGGIVIFGGRNRLITKLDSIKAFNNSKVDFSLKLFNNSSKNQELIIDFKTSFRPVFNKVINVPAGETQEVKIQKDFLKKPSRLILSVTNKNTREIYFNQDTPVFSKNSFNVEVMPIPSKKMVKIKGDFSQLNIPDKLSNVKITLKDKENNVLKIKELKTPHSTFLSQFDFAGLAVDKEYTFGIEIFSGKQLVSSRTMTYQHLPLPEWFHNKLGFSDKVPEPWIAMTYKNNKVLCWGREYRFDNKLFPTRLTTQNKNILSAPFKLLLTTAQGTVDLNKQASGESDLKAVDTEISFIRELKKDNLSVSVATKTEYDGFMWHKMLLTPQVPVKIDSLVLELPLDTKTAKLMIPYDYTLKTTGLIREWRGSIRPFWVGNAERGIQFVAEESYNWKNDSRENELKLIKKTDKWFLQLNLIGSKTLLKKPLSFAFGFQVTPVKRVHLDHRKWRIGYWSDILNKTKEQNIEVLVAMTKGWAKVYRDPGHEVYYPFVKDNATKKTFSKIKKNVPVYGFPYYQLHEFWYPSPEFKQFGYEWICSDSINPPSANKLRNQQITVCQGARTFQDVVLYGLDLLQKQCNPRGYYFDMSQPRTCHNSSHGCGFKDGGRTQATFNVLGTRQMVKRIYTHLKKMRPDGFILYHNSGQVCMPVHGFADLLLDGENFNSILYKNRGYEERLTPDTYRSEYLGYNLGTVVALLPEFRISSALAKALKTGNLNKEQKNEYAELATHINYVLGLTLLHDSPIWDAYFYNQEPVKKYYNTLKKIDYASGKHKFIPYWNQTITQKLPKSTYVSFYTLPGEVIVVVMNYQNKTADIDLMLDLFKLEMKGNGFKVENINNPERANLSGNKLSISKVPPFQYRVIRIKKK